MNDQEDARLSLPEYKGERDMQAFWQAVKLKREPATQRWFLPVLLLFIIGSVPWYRSEGQMGMVLFGFPVWIWTSIICSLGVAIFTALGILGFWRDDDETE